MTAILLFLAWAVSIALAFLAGAFAGVEHEKRTMLPILVALRNYIDSATALTGARERLERAERAVVMPSSFGARAH
jgi:hypothetical protein